MIDAIISGLLLGLALVFSVGPVIFTIIKLRINYGIKSALYFVAGVWISDVIWIIAANFFGSLLIKLIAYNKAISVFGGLFLVGLGLFYLFIKKYQSKEEVDNGIAIGQSTYAKLFATGFLINTLNPAVIGLWLAASTKALSNSFDERLVIFSICLFLNMGADVAKIYLAGKLRDKLTDKNINIINKISGLLFVAFGIAMLIGAFFHSKY